MIILDTNVLLELMKVDLHPSVVTWLDQQSVKSVWITVITAFKTRYGLSILQEGHKRQALETEYERLINEILESRILSLDQSAANAAGRLATQQRMRGIPVEFRDTLIAGIALTQRATLATRNIKDFEAMTQSLRLVNPWNLAMLS